MITLNKEQITKESRVERALERMASLYLNSNEAQRKRVDAIAEFYIGRNYPSNSIIASAYRIHYIKLKGERK